LAVIGTAVKNGIELARTERADLLAGVSFAYQDDQFDPKQSLTAYRRLTSGARLAALFGFGDALAYVLGPLTERSQLPFVNFNFEAGPAKNKRYLVRAMNHTQQYMSALADDLVERGFTRFAILRTESPFFNAMSESFRHALGSRGSIQEIGSFGPVDTEFKATLLKLKSSDVDVVGLFLTPDQLVAFMNSAHELWYSSSYFGTDLFETAAGIVPNSAYFEGCRYPDNEVSPSFRSRYSQTYGNRAQLTFAASGYDMAILIGTLLAAEKQVNMDGLRKVHDRVGELGKFSFVSSDEYGQFFEYPVRIKSIKNGVGVVEKQR
jgi:ABC-type branched-subunit amino acid transport system substrate-binding protein